jgi:hypothetical protein
MGLKMDRPQRLIVGVAFPALFAGLTFIPWLVVRNDLPAPIAVHFDGGGTANGSMPVLAHLVLTAAFTLSAAAVLAWAAWRPSSTLGLEAAIACFMGWLMAFVSAMVLFANEGHDRWQDATLGFGAVMGATGSALGASIPVALMVRWTGQKQLDLPARPIDLAGSERVAWFGRARSVPFAAGSVLLVLGGTVLVIGFGSGAAAPGFVLLAVGLALVSFISVDVSISEQGIRVRAGAVHWPRVELGLDEIERARAVDFKPMANGVSSGWGYRGSLRLFRSAAWVLRAGPALELDLTGDRHFTVTVDDADEAAAIVNGLVARATGAATV